ncbi:MAG: hypothetical protein QOF27_2423 [Gaiellaceae bacterium]|nr:hypothetical protein [Gaiellaceae bacterium]
MPWDMTGSIALGIVIGYISMMFVVRSVKTDATFPNLAGFVGVMVSGAAVQFIADRIGNNSANFGQYATGLGIGFVLYLVLYRIGGFPTLYPLSGSPRAAATQ